MAPNVLISIQWYKEAFTHDVGGFAKKLRLSTKKWNSHIDNLVWQNNTWYEFL